MDPEVEDLRLDELGSLRAIFPELEIVGQEHDFTFKIEVPVNPVKPVTVMFPAASTETTAGPAGVNLVPGIQGAQVDSHELAFLPSVHLQISLPKGYPSEKPLEVEITSSPQWLPSDTVRRLQADAPRLWDEMGRDMVAFSYIDHVQQAAEDAFGLTDATRHLEVDSAHKIAILDYDIKARRAAFERETYTCGVCLDPKKGSVCHKFLDCGHIFCRSCLQDFYNNAITQGDLRTVQCLEPNCAKKRSDAQAALGKKKRRPRTFISPSELLQIGLSEDTVRRYVTLKYKTELESDKNTVYCPRIWCGGAARSKKHKRPEGFEFAETDEVSEDDDETAPDSGNGKAPAFNTADLLAICEDCGYAFCSRCRQSWHGEFVRCIDKREGAELSVEEKASVDYLHLHTTPCPTCGAPAQKTHGCNHMICFCCATHFCYLCSSWLDPINPYQHFNKPPDGGKITSCYMRLWELEEGDGDDVGLGFAGGNGRPPRQDQPAARPRAEAPARAVQVVNIVPEIEEPDDSEDSEDSEPDEQDDPRPDGGVRVEVAREGPLVLRIAPEVPAGRPAGRPAVPPAAPVAPGIDDGHGGAGGLVGERRGGGRGRQGAHRGAQRGRGNRGIGPRGRGGGHRQNLHGQVREGNGGHIVDVGGLDPNQADWIRRFVALALRDEEDDMADDDERVAFRA